MLDIFSFFHYFRPFEYIVFFRRFYIQKNSTDVYEMQLYTFMDYRVLKYIEENPPYV